MDNVFQLSRNLQSSINIFPDMKKSPFGGIYQNEPPASVHLLLIAGKNLKNLPDSKDPPNTFVRIELAPKVFVSEEKESTASPDWREVYEFDLSSVDSSVMNIQLIGSPGEIILGEASLDLVLLELYTCHRLKVDLSEKAGSLYLQVTICCFDTRFKRDFLNKQKDFRYPPRNEMAGILNYIHRSLPENINTVKSLFPIVGELRILVIKAIGLPSYDTFSSCDPYCVVELVNSRFKTRTIKNNNFPVWNSEFVIPIYDIHEYLEITLYDEDTEEDDLIGKTYIPIIKIQNYETRWYVLKGRDVQEITPIRIKLKMDAHYNLLKSSLRILDPREKKYAVVEPVFKFKYLKVTVRRCMLLVETLTYHMRVLDEIFNWKHPIFTLIAFFTFCFGVFSFEVHMFPLLIVIYLAYSYLYLKVFGFTDTDLDTNGTEEEEKDLKSLESKMGLNKKNKEKSNSVSMLHSLLHIQTYIMELQQLANEHIKLGEKIQNAIGWKNPHLNLVTIAFLLFLSLFLYLIPLRYAVLIFGIKSFLEGLIFKDLSPSKPILYHLISRYPSRLDLERYR